MQSNGNAVSDNLPSSLSAQVIIILRDELPLSTASGGNSRARPDLYFTCNHLIPLRECAWWGWRTTCWSTHNGNTLQKAAWSSAHTISNTSRLQYHLTIIIIKCSWYLNLNSKTNILVYIMYYKLSHYYISYNIYNILYYIVYTCIYLWEVLMKIYLWK